MKILQALALCFAAILFGGHSGWGQTTKPVPAAIYRHGVVSATIPYDSQKKGFGALSAEILDPEGRVIAQVRQATDVVHGKGTWRVRLVPNERLALADLVWQRFRYQFTYDGGNLPAIQETIAFSRILSKPVVRVLGQKSYLGGSQAAIRFLVTDEKQRPLRGRVRVQMELSQGRTELLYSGSLNRSGTTEAQLQFPAGVLGSQQLHFVVDTPLGSAEYVQPVRLESRASILLSTEKPIYQPGQTIHVRSLALDRGSHKAVADRNLAFEIEDSRGNKVFRKATQTDRFGVASAEFTLAEEVNLGTYHLRAVMTGPAPDIESKAEVAVNVERYVLPKFKVEVDFDRKDGKPRKDYRPGERVRGTVRARYFFGEPVGHAEVAVKVSAMDVSLFEAGSSDGKTDGDGNYRFDLKLPDYFAGRPVSAGAARVLLEATVKDSAGHSESRGEPVIVSPSALLVTALPEAGRLIPNLENQVFILASYADGTPAEVSLNLRHEGSSDERLTTGKSGIAQARLRVGSGRASETIQVEAVDQHGNRLSTKIPLEVRDGSDQVLLRSERAVYRVGDLIQLHLISTRGRGTAYVDVIQNHQTILTRSLELEDGRAALILPVTPSMAGTLDINAYLIGQDAQIVADHRLLFVQPADELKVEAVADAPSYKPGAEASFRFRVTNQKGEGVSAALGLQVVDEAVFALAEKQPGFAKVFFHLEQEALKPRVEVHSLSLEDVVARASSADEQSAREQDLAARALFSATEMAHPGNLDVEFGRELPQDKAEEYRRRYLQVFAERVQSLADELAHAVEAKNRTEPRVEHAFAEMIKNSVPETRDAWGAELRLQPRGWSLGKTRRYAVTSAGPDQIFGTTDDLTTSISVYVSWAPGPSEDYRKSQVTIDIQHGWGPVLATAEITGLVDDPTGAVIPGAVVHLRGKTQKRGRTVHTNQLGQFSMIGIPPGQYSIEISYPGFVSGRRVVSLQARDRAVIAARLSVGYTTEMVEVEANALQVQTASAAVGGVITGAQVRALPVNGRSLLQLTPLAGEEKSQREAGAATPRLRSYFPEALYINPEIITDDRGYASITFPVADSITTWRMSMFASTTSGALGTGVSSLKVFQDFFVDLDLPVTLTQGDRVSIPVAIYNYSNQGGKVSLKLQPEEWFSLIDDSAEKSVSVAAGRVEGSHFTIEAKRIGKFNLKLSATMDDLEGATDSVVRQIEVIPNGSERNIVFNGRLDNEARHTIAFPSNAIPEASAVIVRLYPGPLSQIVEGMESILQMPGGCFEQTSSSTYPNVLALAYMKETGKLTPEVHARAEGYIANGYQRLLTFEVPGGGFSWFGRAPANKILTAYGLMEFHDMSKVHEIDPKLIERTRNWLARLQQPAGNWNPDSEFINEGATDRFNTDALRITAYIAWALQNAGYQGPAVERAMEFVREKLSSRADSYTLALVANFAVDYGKDPEFTARAMRMLLDARTEDGEQARWSTEETGVYSRGTTAAIETTGLAAQALLKWGQASNTARKALAFITAKKDASGSWGSTQATIVALRAMLLASSIDSGGAAGRADILLNGEVKQSLTINAGNSDLFHQFVIKGIDAGRQNSVEVRFEGEGELAYQVAGRYFVPWTAKDASEALSIAVKYDRTKLAQNDLATAAVTVKNNRNDTANMIMIDLGIPPGFELLSEDLQELQEKTRTAKTGRLEKFSQTATQAILYFNSLGPNQLLTLQYRLRAKYPIRARSLQSRVYEYYDPSVKAIAAPVQLEVLQH